MLNKSWLLIAGVLLSASAQAGILKINEAAFTPEAGKITFSEKAYGTQNPVYAPGDYGGAAGAPTVSFGGYFVGQSMGGGACGGAPSGCVVGSPTGTLALDANSPKTFITGDGANPTSPVLSGSPTFNGPVSILFDVDLAGVGLDGGYFNAIGGTAITAFDRAGNVLGQVKNEGFGIEFLGLVMDNGLAKIAGLQFSLVGAEPAGFAIDNLRFGKAGQVIVPGQVPLPAALPLMASAIGLGAMARRKKAAA